MPVVWPTLLFSTGSLSESETSMWRAYPEKQKVHSKQKHVVPSLKLTYERQHLKWILRPIRVKSVLLSRLTLTLVGYIILSKQELKTGTSMPQQVFMLPQTKNRIKNLNAGKHMEITIWIVSLRENDLRMQLWGCHLHKNINIIVLVA